MLINYLKGVASLYFLNYLRVVIILFSTGLCKSTFSPYSFVKLGLSSFCASAFCDCNGPQTHNHLVRKRTLNHLAKLAK